MPRRTSYGHVLMLVGATACWGVGTVVTKQVLDHEVAPLTLLPIQLTASCLFLLILGWLRRDRVTWSPQIRKLAALGVLNPGLAYALGLIGLSSITASMSVLLWAAEPILILLFAFALLREHIPTAMAAALAAAVLGVILVVYQPGPTGDAVGIVMTLAAVSACSRAVSPCNRYSTTDPWLSYSSTVRSACVRGSADGRSTSRPGESSPTDPRAPRGPPPPSPGSATTGSHLVFGGLRQDPRPTPGPSFP